MAELFFGEFRFDTRGLHLEGADGEVEMRAKTLELLTYLINNRNRFVPRDELAKHLWPDVTVTESSLTQCISELRHALGDSSKEQRYIETRIKKGYRFVDTVYHRPTERLEPLPPPSDGALVSSAPLLTRYRVVVSAAVVICVLTTVIGWWFTRSRTNEPVQVAVFLVASPQRDHRIEKFALEVRDAVVAQLSTLENLEVGTTSGEASAPYGYEVELECGAGDQEFEIGAILREKRSGNILWGWTWVTSAEAMASSELPNEVAERIRQQIVGTLSREEDSR